MIKFTIILIVLTSPNFTFGQPDTVYHTLHDEVMIHYEDIEEPFYREHYYNPKTNEPFNGWVIDQYKNKSVTVFKVRDGYREGFYLWYRKEKFQYVLGYYQYYEDGFLTTTVGCTYSKSKGAKIFYVQQQQNFFFLYTKDSLKHTALEYSGKDSTLYKSETYSYPKNRAKPSKGNKFEYVQYPSHDIHDSICYAFCSNLLNNFPLSFNEISDFPAPPKFYVMNFSCGRQTIPVFNYKYVYPETK